MKKTNKNKEQFKWLNKEGLVYEYIIGEKQIKKFRKLGLNENGVIKFAYDIMFRYFKYEYLDQNKIKELNEE